VYPLGEDNAPGIEEIAGIPSVCSFLPILPIFFLPFGAGGLSLLAAARELREKQPGVARMLFGLGLSAKEERVTASKIPVRGCWGYAPRHRGLR
jgi:hypothetical protein